jgi:LPPG:FO 2-phospho-L-lactate transferase
MIRMRAQGPVDGIEFRGAEGAHPSEAVLAAIAGAGTIVIGPSNPLASIAPILAVPGIDAALRDAAAPVVAVSPIVGGEVLKGPTAAFMALAGRECSGRGVREHYGDLLDGIVADEELDGPLPALRTATLMGDETQRKALAERVVEFAGKLRGGG